MIMTLQTSEHRSAEILQMLLSAESGEKSAESV